MENNKLQELILKNFIELGYDQSVQKVNELYSQDKISLIQKTKAVSKLTNFGMLNRKDKKLLTKLLSIAKIKNLSSKDFRRYGSARSLYNFKIDNTY